MADIVGFNSLTNWTPVVALFDTSPPISLPNANTVQLTTGGGNRRAIWFNTPQSITQFTANFTYNVSNTTGSSGLSFIIQNDARGLTTHGDGGNGYGSIANSIAVAFNYSFFDANTYVGVGRNGSVGGSEAMNPATAVRRNLNVSIGYTGGNVLTFRAVDASSPAIVFERTYVLPNTIASTLGGSTGVIGFGAGTNGGPPGITQTLSNFTYVVPSPSAAALLGLGGLMAARRRR